MEQAESRGVAWFWVSVIRVVLSGPAFYGLGLWAICRFAIMVAQWLLMRSAAPEGWLVITLTIRCAEATAQFMVGRAVGLRSPGSEIASWLRLCLLETVVVLTLIVGLGRILLGPVYMHFGAVSLVSSALMFPLAFDLIPTLLGALYARRGFRRTTVRA